ncbi:mitochondrial tRNA methylthiotransferase CDK5RAP1-like [Tigriopus californicus]|uniref:mitochondrial tRNA methylthiotransferase CDK5RAP1-like n=1 Tax=Tigriopus californicus TaxID=6832 RepID=UPI0027DA50D9|nr:mitochondrial tRNA methylthiotransferase CDK5RAP1-like [Tigriopus californicus]
MLGLSTRLLRRCHVTRLSERVSLRAAVSTRPPVGPGLEFFLANPRASASARPSRITPPAPHAYLTSEALDGTGQKVYFDVYGCQMNVNDTEVIHSVLHEYGYQATSNRLEADVWLLVTCSIREGADDKIWKKLRHIQVQKKTRKYREHLKVGLLGCMAERLKERLLDHDHLVDLVAGPDAYRDLPRLLASTAYSRESAINVILSMEETYADVTPMRLNQDQVTGFVSIQRGCDNMCSYCIVPFTRGRERSRPVATILHEVRILIEQGVKEITLLGQNVNSYRDTSQESVAMFGGLGPSEVTGTSSGFRSIYKAKSGGVRFADLLHQVSEIDPEVRIRFTSPHPKDFPDQVLHLIAERDNLCSQIHLPAQCGSSRILSEMRRGYTREAYLALVDHVRGIIPNVALSSDMIVGFCGETDEEFQETLSLVEQVKFHKIFNFPYSLREKTHAHRKLVDDVPLEVKKARHLALDALHRKEAEVLNRKFIGTEQTVLIEGNSKRSDQDYQGRNDANVKVIFGKDESVQVGNYCKVRISNANGQVIKGSFVAKTNLSGHPLSSSQRLGKPMALSS